MTMVGDSIARSDAGAKVQGGAMYGVDHREVGMLHGAILRSPVDRKTHV